MYVKQILSIRRNHQNAFRGDFLYNFIYYFPLLVLALIEKILCVRCGNKPLTAADLIDLFVVDCHGETLKGRLIYELAGAFINDRQTQ